MRGGMFGGAGFCALPGVVDETREVAQVLGTQPLLDEAATEAALREAMPGREVIHLATHGFLSEIPLLNGIALYAGAAPAEVMRTPSCCRSGRLGDEKVEFQAGPSADQSAGGAPVEAIDAAAASSDDGFLTMSEVMGIPLSGCELVTVSACHSAEGAGSPGEGVMGLTQGFLYAGTQAVLASLTKVNDEATQELMVEFYRNWREAGMSKAQSLRQAKHDLASAPATAAPCYWAPFVMYGVE